MFTSVRSEIGHGENVDPYDAEGMPEQSETQQASLQRRLKSQLEQLRHHAQGPHEPDGYILVALCAGASHY